jgi:Ca2+-binding EF-hand superfamily protein
MRVTILGVCFVCLVATGCGGGRPDGPLFGRHEEEWHPPVQMLLKYVGSDGRLTRTQMEAGLRRDFEAADKNHSGVLEPDEMRAVNQQRWDEDKSAISPLQDWNGDGVIDFNEFAAAARALFNELDPDHAGVLSAKELRAARGLGPETAPKDGQPGQGGDRRGGPSGGPPGGGG